MYSTALMDRAFDPKLEVVRLAVQREFINRCRKNPSYSLRAFAKYLEIDQSFLSKILKGKRSITVRLAESIVPRLGLKQAQFNSLVQNSTVRKREFMKLSEDEFELLSEWHHFAILELLKIKNCSYEPKSMALRLGIHVEGVRDALERLHRLKFIRVHKDKIKLLSSNNTWANNERTSIARKKLQKALIEKSIVALEQIPFAERDNGSLTVAVNTQRMAEFKSKLKQVRKELADFFQPTTEKNMNEVYQLTISFFPISKKNKSQENVK